MIQFLINTIVIAGRIQTEWSKPGPDDKAAMWMLGFLSVLFVIVVIWRGCY